MVTTNWDEFERQLDAHTKSVEDLSNIKPASKMPAYSKYIRNTLASKYDGSSQTNWAPNGPQYLQWKIDSQTSPRKGFKPTSSKSDNVGIAYGNLYANAKNAAIKFTDKDVVAFWSAMDGSFDYSNEFHGATNNKTGFSKQQPGSSDSWTPSEFTSGTTRPRPMKFNKTELNVLKILHVASLSKYNIEGI